VALPIRQSWRAVRSILVATLPDDIHNRRKDTMKD